MLRPSEDAAEAADACDALVLDLAAEDAHAKLASWRGATGKPVLAFGSHVDAAALRAARAAGADRVVPRSQFESALETLLQEVTAGSAK
jgi:hypothetical protein